MLKKKEHLIYSAPLEELDTKENNIVPFINYQTPAPQRCLDMLLRKYKGQAFQSEVVMKEYKEVACASLKKSLSDSKIIVITDGGLVPKNNPDRLSSVCASGYKKYSIEHQMQLSPEAYEVSHQGYQIEYVEENPNRLIPVDVLRELEMEGYIGELHPEFITTAGVMTAVNVCKTMGTRIAKYLQMLHVDVAMIVSTCGTSTRCGAYIGLAIQEIGIPVVQVANLKQIPNSMGVSHVFKGANISYPFGNLELGNELEKKQRKEQVVSALEMVLD